MTQQLILTKPWFWSDRRDPKAWLRAVRHLAGLGDDAVFGARELEREVLRGRLSRRSVPGLFGPKALVDGWRLTGVGLLERDAENAGWRLSEAGRRLAAVGGREEALEALAMCLLERSVWLRLLFLKRKAGEWMLPDWAALKGNSRPLTAEALGIDESLPLAGHFSGFEIKALGAWRETFCECLIAVHCPPAKNPEDSFNWAALKAPLNLLDVLGWLREDGALRIPQDSACESPFFAELTSEVEPPHALLLRLSERQSGINGLFPLEPVMADFAKAIGGASLTRPAEFAAWTDAFLERAMATGAIELIQAEPGQARHGRGLCGDRKKKLLRWVVHPDVDEILEGMS